MTFSPDDLQTLAARHFREYLTNEIDRLRKENDKRKDQADTDFLRGRIDAHKALLEALTYRKPD